MRVRLGGKYWRLRFSANLADYGSMVDPGHASGRLIRIAFEQRRRRLIEHHEQHFVVAVGEEGQGLIIALSSLDAGRCGPVPNASARNLPRPRPGAAAG